jgi:hypothetical protein
MSELWWPRRFGPSQGIRRTADRPSLGVAGARPPGVPTGLRLQLSGGHTGGEKPGTYLNCATRPVHTTGHGAQQLPPYTDPQNAPPAIFILHTWCGCHSYWRAWFGEIRVHRRGVHPARVKRVLNVSELWWPRRFGPSQGMRRTADRPSLPG